MTVLYSTMMKTAQSGDFYGFDNDIESLNKTAESITNKELRDKVYEQIEALQAGPIQSICTSTTELTSTIPVIISARNVTAKVQDIDAVAQGGEHAVDSYVQPTASDKCVAGPTTIGGSGTSGFSDAFKPVKEGVDFAKEKIASLKQSIQDAASQVSGSIDPSAIQGAIADIQSKVGEITAGVDDMVKEAKAAVDRALSTIKAQSFMSMFNSKDPCVSEALSKIQKSDRFDAEIVKLANNNAFKY